MIKRFISLGLMVILMLIVVEGEYKLKDTLLFASQKEELTVEPIEKSVIESHIQPSVEPKIKPVELLEPMLDSITEPAKLLEPNFNQEVKPIEPKKPIIEVEPRLPNNEPRLP